MSFKKFDLRAKQIHFIRFMGIVVLHYRCCNKLFYKKDMVLELLSLIKPLQNLNLWKTNPKGAQKIEIYVSDQKF